MRLLFDTNFLVVTANTSDPTHETALKFLDNILKSNQPFALTWVNVYEFLRTMTHPTMRSPYKFDEALRMILKLIQNPECDMLTETKQHSDVLADVVASASGRVHGNFVHDCHIAALMKEHGLDRIATADSGFRRFPFLKVIDFQK